MGSVGTNTGSLLLHPIVAPILAGVLTHVACNKHEPTSLSAFALVSVGPPLLVTAIASPPGGLNLVIWFLRSFALYVFALFTSIALYRLSPFHPLAKYPGPWQARVTRFWAVKKVKGQWQHHYSHQLFQQYGDVVRTGPNHLIFRDPKAIPVILGARNPWPKGGRYDISKPDGVSSSVLSTIDPGEHSKKRRVWDLAFTSSALKSYEPMLQKRTSQLVAALKARTNQRIDLAEWLAFMALDYMGDFAWGGVFEFMRDGDPDGFRALGEKFVNVIETAGAIPWLKPIIVALPRQTGKLLETSFRVAKERQESGSSNGQKDLFYYLLDEDGSSGHPPMSTNQLAMEATLAITAGSDTTSTAMANAYHHFMNYPAVTARLRKELDEAADASGLGSAAYDIDIDEATLANLPYLNAVINETIRLQPAVPNGVQRTPPKDNGPVNVAGHLVPVGTTCQIPTWSLHRDPRHFSPRPEEFWPERWLPEALKLAEAQGEEFVLNMHAYMPFNYGPGNCVGRSLALAEMRKVLSSLIRRFDINFAPGYAPQDWGKTLRDQYIVLRGTLPVVVTERK